MPSKKNPTVKAVIIFTSRSQAQTVELHSLFLISRDSLASHYYSMITAQRKVNLLLYELLSGKMISKREIE